MKTTAELISTFQRRERKQMMKIARRLMEVSSDYSYCADCNDATGFLVFFSYEPFERQKVHLDSVINALKPFLNARNCDWEWHLFTKNGLLECMANGDPLAYDYESE